ncbi:MAG: hypothetical protein CMI58_05700 [Parcubacteria group bacterium]|jgi:hypothetical protein|nr:hypothetical protein [Parcubacteria group bacterium]|tara:strand:- start:1114 stop:2133 length:1020 start_codon:yes stop_codon:yes gene_type:complete
MKKAKIEKDRKDTLRLQGKDIPIDRCYLPQTDLSFYPENPRIYSLVYSTGTEPSQDEIESKLIKLDHVRQLSQNISTNGGLTDPILVRGNDFVVLEGNSRLAAYRLLSKKDPVKWSEIQCILLPEDISESLVFALLGQYHIIGRKDWAPYEQAGYLYRTCNTHDISPETVAKDIGITKNKVKFLIEVYAFMVEHKDVDVQHWSYYEEYLKSRPVQRARKLFPKFDKVIVEKVLSGEIEIARDVRDKVAKIADGKGKAGQKNLRKFIETRNSLEECYEHTIRQGGDSSILKMLNSFREKICDPDFKDELKTMPEDLLVKCDYEIKKIGQRIAKFKNIIND